jgi:hypothetical protein
VIRRYLRIVVFAGLGGLLLLVQACQYADPETAYPRTNPAGGGGTYAPSQSVFGDSGLNILGGKETAPQDGGGGGIGVNSFLWRASLDTISFMPLASADPFGGVIITDWYSPPETQGERFKVTVYILGRDLRADGVRAAVFRQNRDGADGWIDAKVDQNTTIDLENAILTRARQLRIAGLQ